MPFAAAVPLIATAAAGVGVGTSIYSSNKQAKASKQAASDAQAANAAAIQSVKDAQDSASTNAANQIQARQRARASSQSVFTNPLGISDQATVAKKTLTGQ